MTKRHWLQNIKVPIPCPDDPEKSLAIQGKLSGYSTASPSLPRADRRAYRRAYRPQKTIQPLPRPVLSFEGGSRMEDLWTRLVSSSVESGSRKPTMWMKASARSTMAKSTPTMVSSRRKRFRQGQKRYGASLRYAEPNDVVIAGVSETIEDVGKAVAWLGEEKVAIHDDSYAFRQDMNPKFIAYAMQTHAFHDQKAKYVSSGKIKRLLIDGVKTCGCRFLTPTTLTNLSRNRPALSPSSTSSTR